MALGICTNGKKLWRNIHVSMNYTRHSTLIQPTACQRHNRKQKHINSDHRLYILQLFSHLSFIHGISRKHTTGKRYDSKHRLLNQVLVLALITFLNLSMLKIVLTFGHKKSCHPSFLVPSTFNTQNFTLTNLHLIHTLEMSVRVTPPRLGSKDRHEMEGDVTRLNWGIPRNIRWQKETIPGILSLGCGDDIYI
jgi:hypothetical protein